MEAGSLQGTSTFLLMYLQGTSIAQTKMEILDNFFKTFFKSGLVVCTSGACLAGLTAPQYRSFQLIAIRISLNLKINLGRHLSMTTYFFAGKECFPEYPLLYRDLNVMCQPWIIFDIETIKE